LLVDSRLAEAGARFRRRRLEWRAPSRSSCAARFFLIISTAGPCRCCGRTTAQQRGKTMEIS
jgi:hypothetical protein